MTALQPTPRDEAIVALFNLGWPPEKIAKALKRTRRYIDHLTIMPKRNSEICALYENGMSLKELSTKFNLSTGRIKEIIPYFEL